MRDLYAADVQNLKVGDEMIATRLIDFKVLPDGFAVIVKSQPFPVDGDALIVGCQRIPFSHILGTEAGALERKTDGRVVATATMIRKEGERGWWIGDRAFEHGQVKQYVTSMKVSKVVPAEVDGPDDTVRAEMQPGLYACGNTDHRHLFFLNNLGQWAQLSRDRLHGGVGSPQRDCSITKGASTTWLTTMTHASSTDVTTRVLRKHATSGKGRIVGVQTRATR